jgi:hypothetical protein
MRIGAIIVALLTCLRDDTLRPWDTPLSSVELTRQEQVLHPSSSRTRRSDPSLSDDGFYISKLLVPIHLSTFYPLEFVSTITLTVAAVALLASLVIWKLRDRHIWAAGWIPVSLFPVLLVSRIAVPLADRDLYLPSVGFVWLAAMAIERLGRRPSLATLGVAVVVYGALTLQRLPVWRDDLPLLESELRANPDKQSVRLLLASERGRRGEFDLALVQLEEILKREPNNLEALVNKAGILSSIEDWPRVRFDVRRGVRQGSTLSPLPVQLGICGRT